MTKRASLLPWTLAVLLAGALSIILLGRRTLVLGSQAMASDMETLRLRIEADSLLLEGHFDDALRLYDTIVQRTGDTLLIQHRRALVNGRMPGSHAYSSGDPVQLMTKLREAERQLERYRSMELDGFPGARHPHPVIQEHQGASPLQDGSDRQASGGSTQPAPHKRVLRFPSAKKGEEVIYLGDVERGMANGEGTGVWRSGSVYEGQWMDGLRHGKGVFTWPDGERYEGDYAADRRTGRGVYTWKNGQRWEGEWKDDMRHGEGVLFEANGKVRVQGVWDKDKLVTTHKSGK